jgi:hypothetical protein
MELLGDVGHAKSRFGLFGDLLVSVQVRWMVCAKRRNSFGCSRPFSLVKRFKWKHVSASLEIVLILTQDRCTVWAECTIGLENHFERTRWNS